MEGEPAYRLEKLGWLQFQLLCEAVGDQVGVPASSWVGLADSARIAVLDNDVSLPDALGGERLAGPVTLICAYGGRSHRLSTDAAKRVRTDMRYPGATVLFTSLPARTVRRRLGRGNDGLVIIGCSELGQLLDASPELRLRLPSVLGVRGQLEPLTSATAQHSRFDLAAAVALARVYAPTAAYASACAALQRHGFAVLTGPPEMGKTAIARMIGLVQLTCGWEVHECIRPEQVLAAYRKDRAQVFVADDAFGSTEYRPDAADRWALDLDRILRATDSRHWLIWTSRPAPLRAGLRRVHREHGIERFPQPAEVQVDAANLSVEEKALILFRHALEADLRPQAVGLVQRHGFRIVSHPHFTPERIRRFVGGRLLEVGQEGGELEIADLVELELRDPTAAMAESLDALEPAHRALLVAMLDVPPGPAAPRDLGTSLRRHAAGGRPRPLAELVDRLADHFLSVSADGLVSWVHPSWRDLMIDRLAADPDARRRFISTAGLDGFLLAVSTEGGPSGARRFPLLREDADWDALAGAVEPLIGLLDDSGLQRLLTALEQGIAVAMGETIVHSADRRALAELCFVAGLALERCRAAVESVPPALGLLEVWLSLDSRLSEQHPAPDLSRVWAELLPGTLDRSSSEHAARLDDWSRLVEMLSNKRPQLLEQLSPDPLLLKVIAIFDQLDATAAAEPPVPSGDLYAQAVRRLGATFPPMRLRAGALARRLRSEPAEVAPSHVSAPFGPEPSIGGRQMVKRVLSDLTPSRRPSFFP